MDWYKSSAPQTLEQNVLHKNNRFACDKRIVQIKLKLKNPNV